jgi:hypothetical protein
MHPLHFFTRRQDSSEVFFSQSYLQYGHLATKTLMKQIWAESEPFGLTLRAHRDAQWFPSPQGLNDISLMAYATGKYDKKSTILLNKYRMHLQVTSLYDG